MINTSSLILCSRRLESTKRASVITLSEILPAARIGPGERPEAVVGAVGLEVEGGCATEIIRTITTAKSKNKLKLGKEEH